MTEKANINWEEEFPKARAIINEWDPLALIEDGEAEDSYDFLTLKIFSGIKSDKSDEEIAESVIDLMATYYQLPVEEFDLEGLALQIIRVVEQMREKLNAL
jgi:hypothetical protein